MTVSELNCGFSIHLGQTKYLEFLRGMKCFRILNFFQKLHLFIGKFLEWYAKCSGRTQMKWDM